MPIFSTSTGILPTASVASVWKRTPRSFAILLSSWIAWIVPISLLASMMDTSTSRR